MGEIVSFGEWVQTRRNQLRYSRPALAHKISCSPHTIKKIERDERKPSVEIAELLAYHLQISEAEQDSFIRRARGEFVAQFGSPAEMSLAEAQAPAATEETPKHKLPAQTTSFVGRDTELAEITKQLNNPNCRLLTILGAGGMGKTRLCIAVATAQLEQFTDGVVYVPLASTAPATSPKGMNPILGTLADALQISLHGGETPEQQLFSFLRRKEMLIIFDNFEHLLETAVFLSNLLAHAPDVKMLVTSRERLNLQNEWLFMLTGLAFTTSAENELLSAVQLFAQRAQQVKADFELAAEKTAVLRICQLIEGMPLGVELAASWTLQGWHARKCRSKCPLSVKACPVEELADRVFVILNSPFRSVMFRLCFVLNVIWSYSWYLKWGTNFVCYGNKC